MSIPIDDFGDVKLPTRRDRWGRYLVLPPGGRKPVGYVRATTVGDTISDKEALFPWSQVMAMTGMMRRPGLRGRFEALMSEHPMNGPWYGGEEAKKESKQIAAECKEAGGASDRADLGTSRHSIIEQVHRGQATLITQADTQADVDAYVAAIAAAGLVVDPSLCEAIVVHDGYRIAGTADMLRVTVPGYGEVCGDLKTGTTLDFSHGAIAQQLAIYANADNVYRQGQAKDGSQDERLPMPPVSKERALVVHLPAGEARCDLYWVDIAAGLEAVERSLWVRDWRKRKDLFAPLEIAPPTTLERARERMAADAGRRPDWIAAGVAAHDAEGGPCSDEDYNESKARYDLAMTPEQRAWTGAIVKQAIDAGRDFRLTVKRTQRRADIYAAVTKFATSPHWDADDDEAFRAAIYVATADASVFWPTLTLGDALGQLDAVQAYELAYTVDAITQDLLVTTTDEATRTLRWVRPPAA